MRAIRRISRHPANPSRHNPAVGIMPQGMHMHVLAQARGRQGTLADHLDGARADRPVGLASGEEVTARAGSVAQYSRRTASSRGESITSRSLCPLPWRTWMTMRAAVDVLDAEPGDLGEPQARRRRRS